MAEQRIQHDNGTVTVIADSFAPYGEIGGTSARVERDFEAEREADRIPLSALRRQFRCSDDHFNALITSGEFPTLVARTNNGIGIGEPVFSKNKINAFIAERRALVAMLPESVK